jgi:tRNA-splicing ligase RtcB
MLTAAGRVETTGTTSGDGEMRKINKKLLSWASILEEQALAQAVATSGLPFIRPHVALMPDAHWGMGSTVGSVIPTDDVVIPAAVGVDIGCGMAAVRTHLTAEDIERVGSLAPLRAAIEREVPVSMGKYRDRLSEQARPRVAELEDKAAKDAVGPDGYAANWRLQLGTLGSGNHFIELCLDEADRVWVFLHSGSRGVGNRIAKKHVAIAQRLCQMWHVPLPHRDLAYLPEGTDEFWAYLRDLRWAQAFAAANRAEMVDRVVACLAEWSGADVRAEETINCHHNYTERERHFGRDVWLTRKGAINAERGRRGLIPGSMGTRSYVVTGKGQPAAFCSAPHGAGRNFSRAEARKRFTVGELADAMKGIEWRAENADAFLDEIPGAYKDVDVVMADAADLVSVDHTLRQILNVKGD